MAQKVTAHKAKAEVKADWFDDLDAELERKTAEIIEDVGEQNIQRSEINKTLIEDLWKIWKRFNKINVHFTMEPNYNAFAIFERGEDFPHGEWKWRPGFNPASVTSIQLVDKTQDQGRIGDALKINYYNVDDKPHLKILFEYCEGEHYYKYSGWKRIYAQHLLCDEALDKLSMDRIHDLFKDIVKVWYESHLRRNRDILLGHLKKHYEKVETFSE